MEKRQIDPAEKRRVQKDTNRIMLVIGAVVAVYIVYTLVTKNVNMPLFQLLLGLFLVSYIVLSDVVEPWRLGMLKNMTIGQRTGYTKMMVADVVGVGALLYWIAGMNSDKGNDILFPVLVYLLASQMKRKFRPEFEGTDEEQAEVEPEESPEEEDSEKEE